MDQDRIAGAAGKKRGQLKKVAGRALGDEKLKREGQIEEAAGRVRNVVGGLRDSMREKRSRR